MNTTLTKLLNNFSEKELLVALENTNSDITKCHKEINVLSLTSIDLNNRKCMIEHLIAFHRNERDSDQ